MRRSIGAWLFLILLMSSIAGGLGYYKYSEIVAGMAAGASRPEPSDAVATVRVAKSEWAPTTRAIGTVVARQQLELRNEIAGLVAARGFSSGDTVEKGQVLIQLDDRQEQASLAAAEAEARLARANLDRREALRNSPAFSIQEFDKSREELRRRDRARREPEGDHRAQAHRRALQSPRRHHRLAARAPISKSEPSSCAFRASTTTCTSISHCHRKTRHSCIPATKWRSRARTPRRSSPRQDPGRGRQRRSRQPRGPFSRAGKALGTVLRPGAFVDVIANTAVPRQRVVVPLTAVRRSPAGQHVFVIETRDGQSRAARTDHRNRGRDRRNDRRGERYWKRANCRRGGFLQAPRRPSR